MPVSPLVDCHLHTSSFSCDAQATLEEFIARGQGLGLKAICTTEHVDFDPRDFCYGYYDYHSHRAQRNRIRSQGVENLEVLIGAEIDYQSRFEAQIRPFLEIADYDFVLGSVHYVRGEIVFEHSFFDTPEHDNWVAYLHEVLRAVECGLFDAIGHLDILKRYGVQHYGPFDPVPYANEIDAILCACVDTGTGIEINTSGLRGPPQEPFPALPVLKRYRELGGKILTIGSDAHTADDLASGIPDALTLAKAAGFAAVTVFKNRQPEWLPIA